MEQTGRTGLAGLAGQTGRNQVLYSGSSQSQMHSAGSHGSRIRAVVKMQFTAMKVRWPRAPSSQRGGVLFALCETSQLSYVIVRRLPQSLQPAFRLTGGGLGTYLNCQCLIKMDLPSDYYCSLEKPARALDVADICHSVLLPYDFIGNQ